METKPEEEGGQTVAELAREWIAEQPLLARNKFEIPPSVRKVLYKGKSYTRPDAKERFTKYHQERRDAMARVVVLEEENKKLKKKIKELKEAK